MSSSNASRVSSSSTFSRVVEFTKERAAIADDNGLRCDYEHGVEGIG